MANICTNVAVVTSTDKQVLEQVVKEISKHFECYMDIEFEGGRCELEFSSYGPFPQNIMDEITCKHMGKDLYVQVITYELPNELVQHHIYDDGKWTDRLAEKYPNILNTAMS